MHSKGKLRKVSKSQEKDIREVNEREKKGVVNISNVTEMSRKKVYDCACIYTEISRYY